MISRRAFIQALAAMAVCDVRLAHAQSAPDLSFLVLGDWGKAGSPILANVARQMGITAANLAASFIVTTGDNFYPHGVASTKDPLWQTTFESVFTSEALNRPWYPVLGNHDWQGNVDAELAYGDVDSRWVMPGRYFVHGATLAAGGSADFFHLDTSSLIEPAWLGALGDPQLLWLEKGLAASLATWKIVVGHHPVYSGGRHGDNYRLIEELPPLFEKYGVQIYLNGHDHDLQHVVRGATSYITCGSGSEARETQAIEGTLYAASESGFASAEVRADDCRLTFIRADGELLYTTNIPVAS